jgi:hypothetical protein
MHSPIGVTYRKRNCQSLGNCVFFIAVYRESMTLSMLALQKNMRVEC